MREHAKLLLSHDGVLMYADDVLKGLRLFDEGLRRPRSDLGRELCRVTRSLPPDPRTVQLFVRRLGAQALHRLGELVELLRRARVERDPLFPGGALVAASFSRARTLAYRFPFRALVRVARAFLRSADRLEKTGRKAAASAGSSVSLSERRWALRTSRSRTPPSTSPSHESSARSSARPFRPRKEARQHEAPSGRAAWRPASGAGIRDPSRDGFPARSRRSRRAAPPASPARGRRPSHGSSSPMDFRRWGDHPARNRLLTSPQPTFSSLLRTIEPTSHRLPNRGNHS